MTCPDSSRIDTTSINVICPQHSFYVSRVRQNEFTAVLMQKFDIKAWRACVCVCRIALRHVCCVTLQCDVFTMRIFQCVCVCVHACACWVCVCVFSHVRVGWVCVWVCLRRVVCVSR